jgi:hypothetical protein
VSWAYIKPRCESFHLWKDSDSFKAEISSQDDLSKLEKAQALWRTKGPIGKFHNTYAHIRASPQRRD